MKILISIIIGFFSLLIITLLGIQLIFVFDAFKTEGNSIYAWMIPILVAIGFFALFWFFGLRMMWKSEPPAIPPASPFIRKVNKQFRPTGVYLFFLTVFLWQLLCTVFSSSDNWVVKIFGALPALLLSMPWSWFMISLLPPLQQGESPRLFLTNIVLFIGLAINAFLVSLLLKWWRTYK
jgi:hypothetical protein